MKTLELKRANVELVTGNTSDAVWGKINGIIDNQTDLKEELDKKADKTLLDEYYTKTEIDNKIPSDYLTSVPEEYVTEEELNSKGYITEIPSEYALKSDIPDTSKFITEVPSEYVTDSELDAKGYLTEHQSLDNYYTKTEVDNKVANGGSFDSSLYYTKEEVDAKGYITEVPAEYITEDELTAKGYLTEVPDTYALKTDIPDTSNLATKDELPAEYDDTELTNRVSALETSLGNIDTLLDNINGEVV